MKNAVDYALEGLQSLETSTHTKKGVAVLVDAARRALANGSVTSDQLERFVSAQQTVKYGSVSIKAVRRLPTWHKAVAFSDAAIMLAAAAVDAQ